MKLNISDLRIEGRYQVAVHTGVTYNSPPFNISSTLIDQTINLAYDFFYYQRDGCRVMSIVPGYPGHNADHLDDANWESDYLNASDYRNLTGGWHDAGDYNKYIGAYTPLAIYSLIDAYEQDPAFYSTWAETQDTPIQPIAGINQITSLISLKKQSGEPTYSLKQLIQMGL